MVEKNVDADDGGVSTSPSVPEPRTMLGGDDGDITPPEDDDDIAAEAVVNRRTKPSINLLLW